MSVQNSGSSMLSTATTSRPGVPVKSPVYRDHLLARLLRDRRAVIGLVILAIFVVVAVAAPLLAPGNPRASVVAGSEAPSLAHLLGTTAKGEDVLALLIWGSQSSLGIGFTVGALATLIGLLVGLVSAFFGRVVDDVLSVVTNIFLLIPGLPLLIILAAFLPPGPGTIVIVLVATGWAGSARVVRSQALSLRGKDYTDAAVVTGERPLTIMFREMLPNMASIVMSTFLACVIFGIGAQAGLEFLGLGDVSAISWGTNLYWASIEGSLIRGTWWTFVPSGVAIALVAFALALINYAVDEITNPRLAGRTKRKDRRR
ncbi:peptide/nickel transport system permease protein [Microbacterium foliorum]|uniref:Peptide/nickel transport system permease protein n=1 Tax=Microbacterium foliorum TaxID=104336 RepID=A0ABU1HS05_9MICO|nr:MULTISPECIES: ABC transporter permease [Microbacterium]MCP1427781.1 peptide/nickel transport system permease protein [Microbacterium foliorum]MDN3445079.1 ABC transporter permease [Microbacterium sp. APC 3901]MDR6142832.1 peptide/nickel transport system permease protein [Microbacterium foliorum]